MNAAAHVEEIRRLLVEGLSARAIARRTGVSRGFVASVASGRARPRRVNPSFDPLVPPRRCAVCGAMAQPPCLACAIRALAAGGARGGGFDVEPLGLNLRPEHDERYRRVRRRKLRDERRRRPVDADKEIV